MDQTAQILPGPEPSWEFAQEAAYAQTPRNNYQSSYVIRSEEKAINHASARIRSVFSYAAEAAGNNISLPLSDDVTVLNKALPVICAPVRLVDEHSMLRRATCLRKKTVFRKLATGYHKSELKAA